MHKINYNFNLLENKDDVYDQKIEWLKDQINERIDTIERNSNLNDGNLGKSIEELKNQLDYVQPMYDISALIDEAIANANYDLSRYITETEFEDGLNQKLTDYVRSVDLPSIVAGYDYVTSTAVQEMMADASMGTAYAQTLVANAEFYKEYNASLGKDCFVYVSDESISNYSTLEEYYPDVKGIVDPDNKGLQDDEVAERLVRKAEQTFLIIYKQLSLIKQSVTNSDASIDILASIRNPQSGREIVGAIFVKANELGSYIGLNADQIILSADHQLALEAGEFSINTDNFAIGTDGTVVAANILLSGGATAYNMETYYMTANNITVDGMTADHITVTDMTATDVTMNNLTVNGIFANEITLNSKGGYTKIDENGILYAHGAQIDGNVTAKQFQASEDVAITTGDGYSGTVTKSTAITGSAFGMEVSGSLYNNGSERDLSGNSLYIELVDELPNDGGGDINDSILYGVPVLCMKYRTLDGVQHVYRLKPGSWMSDGGADSSKFRWYQQYGTDVLKYNFDQYALSGNSNKYYTASLSSNFPGTMYIFSPLYRNTFVQNSNDGDTVYRLRVDSFGTDDSVNTRLNNLKTYNLVDSNSVTTSNVNDHTVYALKSKIDSKGGTTYCGEAVGSTPITPELCTTYQSYLQPTITAGVEYNHYETFTSISDQYGVRRMFDYILRAAGAKKTTTGGIVGNNDIWNMEGFLSYPVRADIGGTQGLAGNVPFTTNGFYTSNGKTIRDQEFQYDVTVYPMVTINNNGKTASTSTNYVYARCTFGVFGDYNHDYSGNNVQADAPIKCNVGPYTELVNDMYDNNHHTDGEFIPETIELTLSFDCMFVVSNMSFNPLLSTTKDAILDKMYNFLSSYTFEGNLVENALNTHVQFEGTISGKFRVRDEYNSFTTHNVVLTKNTVD